MDKLIFEGGFLNLKLVILRSHLTGKSAKRMQWNDRLKEGKAIRENTNDNDNSEKVLHLSSK